jgi:hypothetical protein
MTNPDVTAYMASLARENEALREQNTALVDALRKAEKWLEGWASAEPYLSEIREALAGAKP